MDFFEHGNAPSAAGAGGETVGDLGGGLRFFDVAVGLDLAERDVEAEADGVVGLECHGIDYTRPMRGTGWQLTTNEHQRGG